MIAGRRKTVTPQAKRPFNKINNFTDPEFEENNNSPNESPTEPALCRGEALAKRNMERLDEVFLL